MARRGGNPFDAAFGWFLVFMITIYLACLGFMGWAIWSLVTWAVSK